MKKAHSDSKLLLLDVNALLALGWPNHQFHAAIVERLERKPLSRWATCALTQLGFVRLSCNPTAVGIQKSPREAIDLLSQLVSDRAHEFVEDLPSVVELADGFERVLGHQQVTDAYLAALASNHDATLLTFDKRMTANAASGIEVLTG